MPRPASGPSDSASIRRPLRVVVLTVIAGESVSVWWGHHMVQKIGFWHEFMDGAIILALALPCLYFFFARPLRQALADKDRAEGGLRTLCRKLDIRVGERTTALEAAYRSLRQSEARNSALVEHSPTGIFTLRNGRIVFGNQRFFEILGLPRPDVCDLDPTPFIHPDNLATVQRVWRRRMDGETSQGDGDYRLIDAKGRLRWVRGRTIPLEAAGGRELLGNIQDVTERREAEQELAHSRETLRQLSARLLTVQEEERKRVAQELHDVIGQALTAGKLMVERAIEGARGRLESCHMEVLQSVVPLLQQTVEETRRICMALRPSILDDLGLVATLNWLSREFRKACPDLRIDLKVGVDEADIPDVLKTTIFRIVQEAVTNAAKHALARRIEVKLEWLRVELVLVVSDDGVGFDPGARRRRSDVGGLGLDSMRERAEQFDGTLWIRSAPGLGTTITVRWPLVEDPDFVPCFYSKAAPGR